MLVESGLTPMQALQSATGWGSTALLANKKPGAAKPPVGIIAEGAYADLVVLAANPLANITNSRKIERVMKGGQFITLGYTIAPLPYLMGAFTFIAQPLFALAMLGYAQKVYRDLRKRKVI